MNKLKNVSIIWGVVAVILFVSLTTMGFIYKNKTKKYKELEEDLVKITKTYTATDFNYPKENEEIIITAKELKEKELIKDLKVKDNKCEGYVVVSLDDVINYKAYIDCGNYKTHGFEKENLEK